MQVSLAPYPFNHSCLATYPLGLQDGTQVVTFLVGERLSQVLVLPEDHLELIVLTEGVGRMIELRKHVHQFVIVELVQ